jgi:putative membrane protein
MKILFSTASVVALLAGAPVFAANSPTNNTPAANAPAANAVNPPVTSQPSANNGAPTQPTGTSANTAQPNGTAAAATSQAQNSEAQNSPDANFVQQAAQGGRAEVAMGNLAEIRGATSAVREFGRWMSTDHTMANDILTDKAQQASLQLPSDLDARDQTTLHHLEGLHGAAFDRAYLAAQLEAHQKTVQLFQNEAQSGQNAGLKQFAQQSLPMLRAHLEELHQLAGPASGAAAYGIPTHGHVSTAQLNEHELIRARERGNQ